MPQLQQIIGKATATALENIVILSRSNQLANRIDASDTPAAMKPDRIPPRVDTSYSIKFFGAAKKILFHIAVLGQSGDNGRVSLKSTQDGKYHAALNLEADSPNVYSSNLKGTWQTAPGHAEELKFAIFRAGDEGDPDKSILQTIGFSVAAIPVGIEMNSPFQLQGKNWSKNNLIWKVLWGTGYHIKHVSDSGPEYTQDLDSVKISEVISAKLEDATGAAKETIGEGIIVGGYGPGNSTKGVDYNATGGSDPKAITSYAQLRQDLYIGYRNNLLKNGKGSALIYQYFKFYDLRTGMTQADAVLVANSGFLITQSCYVVGQQYFISIQKTPKVARKAWE